MAVVRSTQFLRKLGSARPTVFQSSRSYGTRTFVTKRPVLLGGAAVAVGTAGAYTAYKLYGGDVPKHALLQPVHAATLPESQPSVFSQTKQHALYLWIHLKPEADSKACAKVVANLQKHVDAVDPPADRTEDSEIWAGVGFGPNCYSQLGRKTKQDYAYRHRQGPLGEMPSTGGDIFVHAKCDEQSKLFELCQQILKSLPKDSVKEYEDVYSFVFRYGRDLSGFIDGTENPADDESRQEVAVEKETGGSYVITQKWIHRMNVINSTKDSVMEGWVGRSREDSTELKKKPISSHVARMTGGNAFAQPKKFEIVRQSMPYGSLSDKCGLFFIGYAAHPQNFEFMLDRMVGAGGDPHSDDVMRLSDCVKGTYWYFPGAEELKKLR
ncbi:uncharacterized protein LOC106174718 [Lingula anatina]|uniref:Uncharacterized protein LOC106174718 n=1 Tax=Lingula anatina TaxID=7574 RepID=A0A1S3JN88_LINAN|nr:uncharacterized protein LOC106174718 [Lingula anatina]|eukprot:XP_013411842.1 uncharacterized protein LOC106174718 [Lingula anatina]